MVSTYDSPVTSLVILAIAAGGALAPAGAGPDTVPPGGAPAVLAGTVRDSVSGDPVGLAIIRVPGGQGAGSTITDDAGHFALTVAAGPVRLEVRRIGYRPLTLAATAPDTALVIAIAPVPIGVAGITVRPTEDPAIEVMRRVIAHKQNVLSHLHDYRYAADVKFVVRNLALPPDSPTSILVVTESKTTAYWERPNHYQETIVARRETGNLNPDQNLVSVGEIVNFARDRIDLRKYSIVSPIADDALAHYDYRMLDTTEAAGQRLFTIAIIPRSEASPLFVGVLTVADSTYDVRSIDVGANQALRFTFVSNLRYHQRLEDAGGGRWMPAEIRLTGEIHLAVPIPGVPSRLAFEHQATLTGFEFDQGQRPRGIGEYRVVVADSADRNDSATWAEGSGIPLTPAEREAWARIDSVALAPASLGHRVATGLGAALFLATNPTFFHFNRVDGAYLGAGGDWSLSPDWIVGTRAGYAFGTERWQGSVGLNRKLDDDRQIWVGVGAYDQTEHRPALVSSDYNPTFRALLSRIDPLDYFRERGVRAFASGKVFRGTRLELSFVDAQQSSLPVTTDYGLVPGARALRPNDPILPTHLRALGATATYDSRPLLKSKGRDYRLRQLVQTRITGSVEVAAPDLFPGDFSYRRYLLRIERIQRTLNLGVTSITAVGGIATGWVPPQRYFTVDFGRELYTYQPNGFNTLNGNNFSGTRATMIVVNHDFDRLLFAKSGLPGIRSLPFTLNVHVGAFWSDFIDHPANPGDDLLLTAPKLYTEAGFGLGNLTPFLSPFDLAAYFTWQVSAYQTRGFRFGLGLTRL